MNLQQRIGRLERETQARPCPECSRSPQRLLRVVRVGEQSPPEEICGKCGQGSFRMIVRQPVECSAESDRGDTSCREDAKTSL